MWSAWGRRRLLGLMEPETENATLGGSLPDVGGVGFPAVFLIDSGERVVVGHFGIVDAEGVEGADPMIHEGVGVAALDAAGGVFVADEQEHHVLPLRGPRGIGAGDFSGGADEVTKMEMVVVEGHVTAIGRPVADQRTPVGIVVKKAGPGRLRWR